MVTISDISFVLSEFVFSSDLILAQAASTNSIILKDNESCESPQLNSKKKNRIKFGDRQLEFKRSTASLKEILIKIVTSLRT